MSSCLNGDTCCRRARSNGQSIEEGIHEPSIAAFGRVFVGVVTPSPNDRVIDERSATDGQVGAYSSRAPQLGQWKAVIGD
jgi:hypothetical protein